jgi:hypothetical protein
MLFLTSEYNSTITLKVILNHNSDSFLVERTRGAGSLVWESLSKINLLNYPYLWRRERDSNP